MTHPLSLTLIAFVCTAGPSFLLRKVIGKNLESLTLMGSALLIGGIVMWIVDCDVRARIRGKVTTSGGEEVERHDAGAGGLDRPCQNPIGGISRHFALHGDHRGGPDLGTFAHGGAGVFLPAFDPDDDCGDRLRLAENGEASRRCGRDGRARCTSIRMAGCLLAIGFVVSFIVAFAVVAWFMNWVRNRGFTPFAIYRILVGTGVLVWALSAR